MRWWKSAPPARNDAEIVAAVRAGNVDAFAELVRRHQEPLYRHARGMGLDHDTSLDLVQDAFIRAYDRLSDCRDPEHFRAWVFRITRNACLDHLKNKRQSTVPFSEMPSVELIASPASDEELNATLQGALASLPVLLREAFLLKHEGDYTYDEIAEMTNSSASAVKMRVMRARDTLREHLENRGVYAA
jgi:RNA polymerase sigma factor (sigma-70 family)